MTGRLVLRRRRDALLMECRRSGMHESMFNVEKC